MRYFIHLIKTLLNRNNNDEELKNQAVYIDSLQKLILERRKELHDSRNQLSAVWGLLENNEVEEAKALINDLLIDAQQNGNSMMLFNGIKNAGLCGLIISKINYAREKHNIDLNVEIFAEVDVKSVKTKHLVTIIGSVLDNAIEVAQKTISKSITLVIKRENNNLTFITKNNLQMKEMSVKNMLKDGFFAKRQNDYDYKLWIVKSIVGRYDNLKFLSSIEQHNNGFVFETRLNVS